MHVPANVLCDATDTEALSMSRDAGVTQALLHRQANLLRGRSAALNPRRRRRVSRTLASEEAMARGGALLNVGRARKRRSNGKG
jgi:hypothetical protein